MDLLQDTDMSSYFAGGLFFFVCLFVLPFNVVSQQKKNPYSCQCLFLNTVSSNRPIHVWQTVQKDLRNRLMEPAAFQYNEKCQRNKG